MTRVTWSHRTSASNARRRLIALEAALVELLRCDELSLGDGCDWRRAAKAKARARRLLRKRTAS